MKAHEAPTKSIDSPIVLLVEGKDDAQFFACLIDHLALAGFDIRTMEGIGNLDSMVKAITLTDGWSDAKSFGIIRDADSNPGAAFRACQRALGRASLPIPSSPEERATGKPTTSVLILPHATQGGSVEDLCLESVRRDPAMQCVNDFFACTQKQGLAAPRNMAKAQLQVFLGSRPEAWKLLAAASLAGYWQWNSRAFTHVRRFLRALA